MELSSVTWRKASYSGSGGNSNNCVEVGVWRKASYSASGSGNCVEVGVGREVGCAGSAHGGPGIVAVRDSKDPSGQVLTVTAGVWQAFTAQVRASVHGLI